jgi:hypothetical protein
VGREAAGWERRGPIPRLQLVGGKAEGAHEEGVGLVELPADPLTEGVEAESGRLLGPVRLALGILAKDGLGLQRLASGLLAQRRGIGFDLLDPPEQLPPEQVRTKDGRPGGEPGREARFPRSAVL